MDRTPGKLRETRLKMRDGTEMEFMADMCVCDGVMNEYWLRGELARVVPSRDILRECHDGEAHAEHYRAGEEEGVFGDEGDDWKRMELP